MAYCKGCNRIIMWGKTADGKNIPLDPKAPVYRVLEQDTDGALIERTSTHLVSHFSTCPQANRFSSSNRDKKLLSAGE